MYYINLGIHIHVYVGVGVYCIGVNRLMYYSNLGENIIETNHFCNTLNVFQKVSEQQFVNTIRIYKWTFFKSL